MKWVRLNNNYVEEIFTYNPIGILHPDIVKDCI